MEQVSRPFLPPHGVQPSSLLPAAQSEPPLVRGNVGTGKPRWGEGHRVVRGPAEAIWEAHPKVGAGEIFRRRGGRRVQKVTLVT